MSPSLVADLLVVVHFLFVAFALLGGALVIRWPWVALIHLPCAAWGVWIEFSGRICPLTPLELHYRALAGQTLYEGGFVAHYILPVLYPEELTRTDQLIIGTLFLLVNGLFYGLAFLYRRRRASA